MLPNQRNDIYGHGRERYDIIEAILTEYKDSYTNDIVWKALKSASQDSKATHSTQWSIVFNNTDRTADIVIRRDWKEITEYDLNTSSLKKTDDKKVN